MSEVSVPAGGARYEVVEEHQPHYTIFRVVAHPLSGAASVVVGSFCSEKDANAARKRMQTQELFRRMGA